MEAVAELSGAFFELFLWQKKTENVSLTTIFAYLLFFFKSSRKYLANGG
jgi:hypothetical protein